MLIEHESGRKFAEFSKSNLHIVGYSIPVNRKISKRTSKHIYTQKDQPNSIPYITSYYKKDGVFVCLKTKRKNCLQVNIKF